MAEKQVGSLIISLEARTAQIQQDMAQTKKVVGDAMSTVQRDSRRAAEAMEETADAAKDLRLAGAAIATGWSLNAVVDTVVDVARELNQAAQAAERLNKQLYYSNGGDLRAIAADVDWLRKTANELGQEFDSTSRAYAQFAGAVKGTALAPYAREIFTSLATAANAFGMSSEEAQGAMLALVQMSAKGVVQAEEFRGQLAERLPVATQAAAAALGVTTGEFNKLLESGQVIADDFLPKFANELRKMSQDAANFGGEAQKASVQFINAWADMKKEAAASGLSEFINGQLNIMTDMFNDFSGSVRRARAEGSGFWGQAAAGGGAVLRFLNPINAFHYSAQSDAARIQQLKQNIAEREKSLYNWSMSESMASKLETLAGLKAELASLEKRASAVGKEVNAGQKQADARDAARKSAEARAKDYLQNGKHQTDAEAYQKKLRDEESEFKAKTAGLEKGSALYEQALKAHEERVQSIKDDYAKKNKPKTSKVKAYGSTEDRELAQLQAQIETEKLAARALADYGAEAEKLTPGQKLLTKLQQEQTVAVTAAAKAHIGKKIALAQELVQLELANRVTREQSKLEKERAEARLQQAVEVESDILDLQQQAQQYGLTAAQIAENTARTWELSLAEAQKNGATEDSIAWLAQQADMYRRLADAQKALQGRKDDEKRDKEAAEQAKKAADEWKRAAEQINQSLTDALMRGFESGKGFAENFRDALKNMFQTLVLRPMISAVLAPVAGGMASLVSGNAWAADMGGGSGQMSAAQGGYPMYGMVNSVGAMFGSMVPTQTAAPIVQGTASWSVTSSTGMHQGVASAVGPQEAAATSSSGASGVSGASMAGYTILGTIAGNYALRQWGNQTESGQRAGSYGAAGGAMAGASYGASFGPWGAAIGAIVGGVLGAVGASKIFGHGGEKTAGGYSEVVSASGFVDNYNPFHPYTGRQSDDLVKQTVDSFVSQYGDMVTKLGGEKQKLTVALGFDSDPKGTADSRISASLGIGDQIGNLTGGAAEKNLWANSVFKQVDKGYGRTSQDLQNGFTETTERMLLAALKASKLPTEFQHILDSVDINTAPIEDIKRAIQEFDNLSLLSEAFKQFALIVPEVANVTLTAKKNIADFAGGVSNFANGLSNYYQNFFSEEEKRVKDKEALQRQFDALADEVSVVGVELPKTRAEFRQLVEGLDLNTEAGQKAYAALINVSGAFASVTEGAMQAAKAQQSAVSELAASAQEWLNVRGNADALLGSIDNTLTGQQMDPSAQIGQLWAELDAGLSLPQQIDVASRLNDLITKRYQTEHDAVQALLDQSERLRDFVQGLRIGDLSTATPSQKLAEAARQYADTLAKAQSGDKTALGNLESAADTYLKLAQTYYASSDQYGQIFGAVTGQLEALGAGLQSQAQTGEAVARQQLAQLEQLRDVVASQSDQAEREYQGVVTQMGQQLAALQALERAAGLQSEVPTILKGLPADLAAAVAASLAGYIESRNQEIRAQVTGWYQQYAGREPDQPGLDYWTDVVSQGTATEKDFQWAAVQSTVTGWYQKYANRAPDQAGLDYWTANVINGAVSEADFQWSAATEMIQNLYQQVLGRAADEAGLNYYRDRVIRGVETLDQVSADLQVAKLTGAYASGGLAPAGFALVGENGPEIVDFSSPGRVYTNEQLSAALKPIDYSRYGTRENTALIAEIRTLNARIGELEHALVQATHHGAELVASTTQQAARTIADGTRSAAEISERKAAAKPALR